MGQQHSCCGLDPDNVTGSVTKKDLLFGWSKSPSWERKRQSGGVLLGILKGRVHDLIASHKIVQWETFGSRDVKRFRFFLGKVFWGFTVCFIVCIMLRQGLNGRMTMFYFHTMFSFQEPAHYLPIWRASCRSLLPQQGCTQNAEGLVMKSHIQNILVLPTRCRFGWFDDVCLGTSKTLSQFNPVHDCLCLKKLWSTSACGKFVLFLKSFAPSLLI